MKLNSKGGVLNKGSFFFLGGHHRIGSTVMVCEEVDKNEPSRRTNKPHNET
jgi:hypothetical protein